MMLEADQRVRPIFMGHEKYKNSKIQKKFSQQKGSSPENQNTFPSAIFPIFPFETRGHTTRPPITFATRHSARQTLLPPTLYVSDMRPANFDIDWLTVAHAVMALVRPT